METPGITTAPSARTVNSLAPKISPLLPESGVLSPCALPKSAYVC
jgi:hypothetical protein